MLFELSVLPLGTDAHLSDEIAEVVKVVEASGLPYQVTPTATCIEGEWDEVMPVIQQCHLRARELSPHVVTMLKIEDDEDSVNKLIHNVASVEEKVGHVLPKGPSPRSVASSTSD